MDQSHVNIIKPNFIYLNEARTWLNLLPLEIWRIIARRTPIYVNGVDIFSIIWPELDRKRLWIGTTMICLCRPYFQSKGYRECKSYDHIPMPIGKKLSRSICRNINNKKQNMEHKWVPNKTHKFSHITCECNVYQNFKRPCEKNTEHNCICYGEFTMSAKCKATIHKCICSRSVVKNCLASKHKCYCMINLCWVRNYSFRGNPASDYELIAKELIHKCLYDGTHYDMTYDLDNDEHYAIILLHYLRNSKPLLTK